MSLVLERQEAPAADEYRLGPLPATVELNGDGRAFPSWRPSKRLRLLLLLDFAVASFYVVWWLGPGRMGTPVLFYLLAGAEAFNLMHHVGLWWAMWATRVDPPPPSTRTFSIDVLIPTRGEPLDVLHRTISAAVSMDLPHRILVLDDGWRPEVRRLARSLGAEYLARSRAKRGGAKAGNLNFGLSRSDAELFAIFDADHVPRPDFLRQLVGYFEDPSVAFVQTPQFYGNSERDEVARGAFEQQAIFYGPICRGKNGLSAAFCCGTNVIFRRAAIDDVGGFDRKSVVEDFVTSMRIHRRGWRSVYYPYLLAEGLGPSDLRTYFRQQFRWARGSIGALLSGEPFKRGFTIGQRFQYFVASTFYLTGLVTSVYLCLPVLYFLGGWSTFSSSGATFMFFYAPYLILALLTIRWGLGGRLRLSHLQYTFGSFPVYALAGLAAILHLPARFRVTKKSPPGGRVRPPVIGWVTVLALEATLIAVVSGIAFRPFEPRAITNISWGLMNVVLLSGISFAALRELLGWKRRALVADATPTVSGRELLPIAGGAQGLREPPTRGTGHGVLTEDHRLVLPEHALSGRRPPSRRPHRPRSRLPVLLGVITVLGFILRAVFIDAQSLRQDEWISLSVSSHYSLAGIWHLLAQGSVETHPPLYHSILHLWVQLAGTSEWALRVPSVIFGTASIPLLYLLGRRLIGHRAAILAAAIGATSPLWVWHSDEARMYPLLLLLGLASTYLLLGALQKGKFLRWAAYALVTGLSFYAHYFALLLPPVHLLYLVVMRAGWRKVLAWLGAMAGAALMFLPWVLLLVSSIQTARFDAITSFLRSFPISFTPFGLAAGLTIFFGIFLVGYQPASHLAAIGYTIAAWPVLALLSVTSRRFSGWKRSRTVAFLALWPALFTGLVLVLAAWNPGVWLHRYMIMVTPPLFLLLALGLSRVIHRQVVALGLILVAFTSLTVLNNMEEGNPARDDFRAASRVVSSDFANGETVIVVPQFATGPFEYYFHDDAAVAPLPWTEVPSRALENVRNVMKERGGRSFWIVLRHADQIWVGSEVTSQLPDLLDGAFVFLARDQVGNVEVRHYRIPPEGR